MKGVYPSLVRINVVVESASDGRMEKHQSAGSGAIISQEGHIVTNHHVAGKATRITCRMPDGEEIEADLVGTDALADIAIVKLKLDQRKNNTPLPVAQFGDSDKVQVGDMVFAMGSPAALSQSVTQGIVSNTAMILPNLGLPIRFELDGEDTGSLVRWIGHDAVIYGGNSGGPLVNTEGEIIGINEVGIGSLGGAIPANLAKSIADQLIRTGSVRRSWIGLEFQPQLKDSPIAKGALVSGVIENSPAIEAGLRSGDIITSYDGVEVNCRIAEDLPVFNRLVLSTPIGKKVTITAIRDGEAKTFELTTIARDRAQDDDAELKQWGITARNLTKMEMLELKRADPNGVLVTSVNGGGACSQAKLPLRDGDIITTVNQEPVKNIQQVKEITETRTRDQNKPVPTLVGFDRGDSQYLTVVELGPVSERDKPLLSKKPWFPAATQVLTEDLANAMKLGKQKGIRIVRVFEGHSAEKAGFKVGDILTKLDGTRIEVSRPEESEIFDEMICQYQVGSEVTFDVIRDGQTLQVPVTLEAPLKSSNELKRYKDEYFEMTVRELAFQDRIGQKVDKSVEGVLVERVEPSGWASLGFLLLDDILLSIDGKLTPDVDTVKAILTEARENKAKRLVFFVKRGIHTLYLELEPSWDVSDDSDGVKESDIK
ncbi:MAG: PDZ domain-containing protein [Planctomycetales bacterium]|nr:PDZ domain-containing protein [Planctomycetales bacterium]